jgi:putrescine importer
MAKGGLWMLVIGEVVIFVGFAVWAYAVQVNGVGTGTIISDVPFKFTDVNSLMTATSLAVLSYLGFDAITTLSEETHNPRKDVPRAIYLSVVIGAGTMVLTGYLGVLLIPNWRDLFAGAQGSDWINTTQFQVAKLAGGGGDWWFSYFYLAGYVIAMGVFNVVATAAGARLLFGMGRDGLLPRGVFAAINKRWQTPHWNIIIIVVIEYVLGMRLQVNDITNLINYGALGGFAALNLGVVWLYYVKKTGVGPLSQGNPANWQPKGIQHFRYMVAPIIGFLVVAWVFASLDTTAKIVGTVVLIIGIVYEAIWTKGWRELPPQLEL